MKIKDVMKRDFVSVPRDTTLHDVARAVLCSGGAAAVIDDDGRLYGVIVESDVRVVGSLIAALDGVSAVKNLLSVRSERSRALA